MKAAAPRYAAPLDLPRPRGARLLEAFSPKLGRRVRFFDRATFDQWIRLEADPAVQCLCERPQRLGTERDARVADFWVQRHDGEVLQVVHDGDAPSDGPQATLHSFGGVAVEHIGAPELAAVSI